MTFSSPKYSYNNCFILLAAWDGALSCIKIVLLKDFLLFSSGIKNYWRSPKTVVDLPFARKKYGGSKNFPLNAAKTVIEGQLIGISKIQTSEAVSVSYLYFEC